MRLLRPLKSWDETLTRTPPRYLLALLVIAAGIALLQVPVYVFHRIYYNPLVTVPELVATACAGSVLLFLSGSAIASLVILQILLAANYLKFFFLREGLIPSDFVNLHEAFVGGGLRIQIVMVVGFATAVLALGLLSNRRHWKTRVAGLAVWAALAAVAYDRPREVKSELLFDQYKQFWLVSSQFQQHGFFVSFATAAVDLRWLSLDMERFPLLETFPPGDIRTLRLEPVRHRPDIHVVLLESFIEPHDFTALRFDREPTPPGIADLIARRNAASYSPVVGGKTAKAEFEVLCGVPDFDLLGTVTFNQMGSSPVDCLPNLLRRAGYRTLVTTPMPGSFFNIKQAYQALGFEERLLRESFTFDDRDGPYLTNGSALRQSLEFVRRRIAATPERPLFNYVVLVGGHFPFERNEARRPDRIGVVPAEPMLRKIVNMSHYTLVALAEYLGAIGELGRDSIVVLFDDHLPPVSDAILLTGGYRGFDPGRPVTERRTFLLVLRNGKPVPLGNIAQYELPDVLLRMISGRCEAESCAPETAMLLRPPGAYARAAPAEELCRGDAPTPACRAAIAKVDGMRRVYQHLLRQSHLPVEGARIAETGAH